jgi:hypothetical protein
MPDTQPIASLAHQLLLQVKQQAPTKALQAELAEADMEAIVTELKDDDGKKAFWINLYNAFFLILRRQGVDKPDIYGKRLIRIAGEAFSLDEIEHGILRKYRWKWSLGYLPWPFYRSIVRRLAVAGIDYRLHFALNCGAKSCPPIAFYSAETLEEELDLASRSFLSAETDFGPGEVRLSRLFLWYRGDFGGKKGTRRIIRQYLDRDIGGLKQRFKAYDWTEELDNFV